MLPPLNQIFNHPFFYHLFIYILTIHTQKIKNMLMVESRLESHQEFLQLLLSAICANRMVQVVNACVQNLVRL